MTKQDYQFNSQGEPQDDRQMQEIIERPVNWKPKAKTIINNIIWGNTKGWVDPNWR